MSSFSIQSALTGLFLFVFFVWLCLSIYVVWNRLRFERRNNLLDKAVTQLGHSQPVMLNAKARSELVLPLITRLPQPVIYRAATDAAAYPPVAEVFAQYAMARWGANVFSIASKNRSGSDRWQRISALSILTRVKSGCIHDLLFDALRDKDADVVSNAVVLLGQLQDRRAAALLVLALHLNLYLTSFVARQLDTFEIPIDDLLEPLLEQDDAQLRYWAVSLLARHGSGGERHTQGIARLADDPDPAVRKAVAQTLGMLDASDEALTVLQLLYDDVAFVRVHAVKALAQFNQPDFAGSLAEMLEDPEWRVRLAANDALSSMEQSGALDAWARIPARGGFAGKNFGTADKVPAYAGNSDTRKTDVRTESRARRL